MYSLELSKEMDYESQVKLAIYQNMNEFSKTLLMAFELQHSEWSDIIADARKELLLLKV
jgi:hypothetical protein